MQRNHLKEGLQEAVLGKLGLGGDTDVPTNASSPAMVNIANQGIVTGANNNKTTVPQSQDEVAIKLKAGKQTFGLA